MKSEPSLNRDLAMAHPTGRSPQSDRAADLGEVRDEIRARGAEVGRLREHGREVGVDLAKLLLESAHTSGERRVPIEHRLSEGVGRDAPPLFRCHE